MRARRITVPPAASGASGRPGAHRIAIAERLIALVSPAPNRLQLENISRTAPVSDAAPSQDKTSVAREIIENRKS